MSTELPRPELPPRKTRNDSERVIFTVNGVGSGADAEEAVPHAKRAVFEMMGAVWNRVSSLPWRQPACIGRATREGLLRWQGFNHRRRLLLGAFRISTSRSSIDQDS